MHHHQCAREGSIQPTRLCNAISSTGNVMHYSSKAVGEVDTVLPGALDSETARQGNEGERAAEGERAR